MNKKFKNLNTANITEWLLIILSVAAVCFVPTIVQMVPVERTAEEIQLFGRAGLTLGDAFSFVKSKTLLTLTAVIVLIRLYQASTYITTARNPEMEKYIEDPVNVFSAFYLLCVLVSAIFSPYKHGVVWGMFERYEGLLILFAYIIVFLNVRSLIKTRARLCFFVGCILLFASLIAFIGVMQFIGKDPFNTDLGQRWILGKYIEQLVSFEFNFNGQVYATLYNPNNAGLYAATVAVFCGVLALLLPYRNILKYFAAALLVAMLLTLIGTDSFAGAIGAGAALAVFFTLGLSYFLRHKRYADKTGIVSITEKAAILIAVIAAGFAIVTSMPAVSSKMQIIINDMNTAMEENYEENFYYKNITTEENRLIIETRDGAFTIEGADGDMILSVTDMNGGAAEPYNKRIVSDEGETPITDEDDTTIEVGLITQANAALYASYKLSNGVDFAIRTTYNSLGRLYYSYGYSDQLLFALSEGNMTVLDRAGNTIDVSEPTPSFGFENNQMFGNTRGYIWSRTFPMLLDRPLFGNGPDSYAHVFPQDDIVGKLNVFNSPYFIVDKPHNFYLQQAVNTGLISLVALLALFVFYVRDTFKTLFTKKLNNKFPFAVSMAIFSAIACFWVGSLAVDSTVSVSPLFWGLLGLGFACNRLVRSDA